MMYLVYILKVREWKLEIVLLDLSSMEVNIGLILKDT